MYYNKTTSQDAIIVLLHTNDIMLIRH